MNVTDETYGDWLANLRRVEPDPRFAERVMQRVAAERTSRHPLDSPAWRVALSAAALAIALSRLVYLAVLARLIPL